MKVGVSPSGIVGSCRIKPEVVNPTTHREGFSIDSRGGLVGEPPRLHGAQRRLVSEDLMGHKAILFFCPPLTNVYLMITSTAALNYRTLNRAGKNMYTSMNVP